MSMVEHTADLEDVHPTPLPDEVSLEVAAGHQCRGVHCYMICSVRQVLDHPTCLKQTCKMSPKLLEMGQRNSEPVHVSTV